MDQIIIPLALMFSFLLKKLAFLHWSTNASYSTVLLSYYQHWFSYC